MGLLSTTFHERLKWPLIGFSESVWEPALRSASLNVALINCSTFSWARFVAEVMLRPRDVATLLSGKVRIANVKPIPKMRIATNISTILKPLFEFIIRHHLLF
jgi:hypothetical protein